MAEEIKIVFKVDGKEITATEKDLKELEKATKKAGAGAKKTQVSMKGLGKAAGGVAVAAAAAGAAILAFGKETLDSTRELQKAITMSGVQAEAFQRQAIAAKTVGIEQDKLGDIYKDVNDKLGDFVATGAGPLADFFDTVGKKVGVTADDFKNLSGDQALGLFVNTLEKANVSQQEMTFHMEALASDSVLLAPLLANNAAEMKRLGDAAGDVLSEEQIANAGRLSAAMDAMSNTIGNKLKGAFIDVATEAANFFGFLDTEAQKIEKQRLADLDDSIDDLRKSLANLADNEMDKVSKSFAQMNDIAFDTSLLGDDEIENAERLREIMQARLDQNIQAFHAQTDVVAAVNEEVKAREELATVAASGMGLGTGEGSGTSVKDLEEEVKARETAAKRMEEINKNRIAARRQINAEMKAEKQHLEDIEEKWMDVIEPAAIHKEDIRELQLLLAKGKITAAEYAEIIRSVAEGKDGEDNPWAGLTDELTSLETKMKDMKSDAIVGIADGFAEMAVSGEASFSQMAAAMLKDIAKLIIKTLILRAITSALGSGGGAPAADQGATITRDSGGSARVGQAIAIGTGAQPEVFVPSQPGELFPRQQLASMMGGGGVSIGSINVTVKEKENETSAEQAQRISRAIQRDMKQLVQGELINQQRSGNILNPARVTSFR